MHVFEVGLYTINGEGEYEKITLSDVLSFARRNGYKKFIVKGRDERFLSDADFPIEEDIIIEKYNEAG